jgi:hypothetical protein
MKRLFSNILLFLLPLVLLIYFIPFERRQRFIQLKDDCSCQGIWLFDRVHHNDNPVDVVFFGSSHTINGIMDEFIEKQLNEPSVHVVNLGYCRYGVNIYYVLMKEIVRSKKPKILFLEVREDENRYSHPVFPYIADANDIFLATPFFNRDLVKDYFDSFRYRLQLLKVQYFKKDSLVPFKPNDFGFMGSRDTASKAFLEKVKLEHERPKAQLNPLERYFYMTYPRIYLKKLSELCIENNIRLSFLYIPEYGSHETEPLEINTYRKYGDVLIPPHEIFEDPDNWFDENHLNHAGAGKLSEWVTGQIRKKLVEIQRKP